jgi:hypothetical protein
LEVGDRRVSRGVHRIRRLGLDSGHDRMPRVPAGAAVTTPDALGADQDLFDRYTIAGSGSV